MRQFQSALWQTNKNHIVRACRFDELEGKIQLKLFWTRLTIRVDCVIYRMLTRPNVSNEHVTNWNPENSTRCFDWKIIKITYFCNPIGYSYQFEPKAISPMADTWFVVKLPKWQNNDGHKIAQHNATISTPNTPKLNSDWNACQLLLSKNCWV